MDVKAEVLSKKFKTHEDFKRSMVKFVMESIEANILSEDMMKMHFKPNGPISTPRRIHLSHPRENEVIQYEWRTLIPSQGG